MHLLCLAVAALPGVLACAGILFCCTALCAAAAFARAQRDAPGRHPHPPSVSILKPIKGLDPGLLEALRSHCTQRYSAPVELLCGLASLDDLAVPVIRRLAAEFPHMRIEVVETPLRLGTNGKVSNLLQLVPHARHELLLIADADIAAGPDYLSRIVAPFADRRTGLVTAPYRGRIQPPKSPTLGSRLEALGLATDFLPGVLTARMLDRGLRFALGSTLLISRPALEAIGGLAPLADVLADDHELGHRVAAAGFHVVLSPEPVSTAVPAYTFAGFWGHQLRWARTVRAVRPGSYAGLVCTHPVPWAVLFLVATGGSVFALALVFLAVLARLAVAIRIGYGVLHDANVLRDLVLLPVRDCVALLLWVWSYAGDTIEWRGEHFRIRAGRLLPLSVSTPPATEAAPGPGLQ